MAVILLIRHAVTDQTGKRLYGRSPGVRLSERGREQAERLAERLAAVPLAGLYVSPLERCRETAAPIARGRGLRPRTVAGVNEVDYGRWAGRPFRALSRTKAWRSIRSSPATFRFPDGETLAEVQHRSVEAVDQLAARHRGKVAAVVTHGDVIRLTLAHYAGVHIDLFQRLEVSIASVSALRLEAPEDTGPRVLLVNDTGPLEDLLTRVR